MGKTCEMLLGEADAVLTPSYKGDSAHYFVEDIVRELKPTNLMGETKQSYVERFHQLHKITTNILLPERIGRLLAPTVHK